MGPLQYLLLKRACSLFLPLESIGLNITVTKSNGHCPWQVGLPQGWSSIIGEVLESIQLNNMVTMSIASWTVARVF